MRKLTKAALLAAGIAIVAGGCASGYYDDDGYYHRERSYYRYNDRYDDRYRDYDSSRYDRSRYGGDRTYTRGERIRVCDPDGTDCTWKRVR